MKQVALVLLLCFVLLTTGSSPAKAVQSYPLTCHASSNFKFAFGFSNDIMLGTLNFNPSSAPAASGVSPGFCAWSDRGFRADEPTTLSFHDIGLASGIISNGKYSGFAFAKLQFIKDLVRDSGKFFVFQVHRDGRYMNVDRIGP